MSAVRDAVIEALSEREMVLATARIKNAICDELARADSAATLHQTEYFNHTYLPDIVMEWLEDHYREVFLRFSSTQRLEADVDRIGQSGPIIFDLTVDGERNEDEGTIAPQEALKRAPDLLLTDAKATDQIRPDRTENMLEHLVTSSVFRAAHGWLDAVTVQRTVTAAKDGFYGAIAGDRKLVGDALEVIRPIFGLEIEQRVGRTLQLLWWVGGSEHEFPISLSDDLELNGHDTQEFLRVVFDKDHPVGDERFWPRLADRLDFDTLVGVGTVKDSQKLNSLMAAYSGRVELSHAAVDFKDRPMPPFDEYSWELDDGFVCLSGPDWDCRMTPHGNRFSQRRGEGPLLSLDEASVRSRDFRVEEATFDETSRQVSLRRKAAESGASSILSLQELADGFEPSAQVRRLTVLSGNSRLTADFERMLVGADPDVSLRTIAGAASVLLAAVRGGELNALRRFLGEVSKHPSYVGEAMVG